MADEVVDTELSARKGESNRRTRSRVDAESKVGSGQ